MRKLLAYNLRLFAWLAAREEASCGLIDSAVVANHIANKPDADVVDAHRRTMSHAVSAYRDYQHDYYRSVPPDVLLMGRICEHIARIVWNDAYVRQLTMRDMWKQTRELCAEAMKLSMR